MNKFSHFDEKGKARMVDVSEKKETVREAVAQAIIRMSNKTMKMIRESRIVKGDVLTVAKVAGIMAAKNVSGLIPMAHPLNITACEMDFKFLKNGIKITAAARIKAQTGVEMEALTAASVAALTIYDMCKAVERGMTISDVCLLKKTGGKSGEYKR